MYKKKIAPISHRHAPFIASGVTLLIVIVLEYLFAVPSAWIHKIPDISLLWDMNQDEILCTEEYAPVCGKDGQTYANSCMIRAAWVAVAKVGTCASLSPSSASSSVADTEEGVMEEETPLEDGGVSLDGGTLKPLDLSNAQVYTSNTYEYTVSLPKYAYYQGSNAPDKKGHRLAIDLSSSGSENFDLAMIRTLYSPSGLETLSNAKKTLTLEKWVFSIAYEEPLSMKAMDIIRALEQTAKSLTASGAE